MPRPAMRFMHHVLDWAAAIMHVAMPTHYMSTSMTAMHRGYMKNECLYVLAATLTIAKAMQHFK